MKNEIKEECKKLWAKVKPYLPLIGVIGLVCSMILGLVCFWRCSEEDNIVQANADEILSQYDTYYNGDYVYDSLKTQFAYSVPCNLFRYETSPNLIDKTASLETTVIYGYLQTLSYSKSVNNANTYYQMFNICNNTHCALDYADYALSFWVDPTDNVEYYIYDGFEYSPMDFKIEGSRKYWYTTFLWTGSEILSVYGFGGGILTLNDFQVTYGDSVYFSPVRTLNGVMESLWDNLNSMLYLFGQSLYETGVHNCRETHETIYNEGYEAGKFYSYDEAYKEAYGHLLETWSCPDCPSKYQNGYDYGLEVGYENGHEVGYEKGFTDSYGKAYDDLRAEVENEVLNDKETFLEGLFSIMDAPMRIIRDCFDFVIFGVNISELVFFILTAVIVVFVVKKVKGG